MSPKLKPKCWLLPALLSIFFKLHAFENYFCGSRSAALSGSGITITDVFSVSQNQAGLSFLEKNSFAASHQQVFLLKELGLSNLVLAFPFKNQAFGLQASYFGYSQYHESKLGLAYSLKIAPKISLGMQFDYFRSVIPVRDFVQQRFTFEMGILAIPLENLKIAAHVFNPLPERWNPQIETELPIIARFGGSYEFDKKLILHSSLQFHSRAKTFPALGLEYFPIKNIAFRAGISGGSSQYSFGLGYSFKKTALNFAFVKHESLGTTPSVDLIFFW